MTDKKKIAILGSTGSVGRQAIESIDLETSSVVLLTGGKNIDLLANQARDTKARYCAVPCEKDAAELRLLLSGENTKVYGGPDAICKCIEESGADIVLHSISGMAGISSAIASSKIGARLAIANKESIISIGDEIFKNIRAYGGELIPVDSEHCAIFQCLLTSGAVTPSGDKRPDIVKRILLTASGGPFFGMKKDEIEKVTPEMALAHPTWKMGSKITIDCATLMNKGFEIIEATRLFGVDVDKIEVVIHRQSIVHSMVEYIDNMVIAQLGAPDMRSCIRYALSYPERMELNTPGLDFTTVGSLTFDKPDRNAFPLLDAAERAYRKGTTAPASLIASDEEAVSAFLSGKISLIAVSDVVCETLEMTKPFEACTVETVFEAEREARSVARGIISSMAGI